VAWGWLALFIDCFSLLSAEFFKNSKISAPLFMEQRGGENLQRLTLAVADKEIVKVCFD